MPTLLQRIKKGDTESFSGHLFPAVLRAYFRGFIGQGKCYTSLGIAGTGANRLEQQADLELIKTKYDAFPGTNGGKIDAEIFLQDVMAHEILLGEGVQNKAQFNSSLGLTLDEG